MGPAAEPPTPLDGGSFASSLGSLLPFPEGNSSGRGFRHEAARKAMAATRLAQRGTNQDRCALVWRGAATCQRPPASMPPSPPTPASASPPAPAASPSGDAPLVGTATSPPEPPTDGSNGCWGDGSSRLGLSFTGSSLFWPSSTSTWLGSSSGLGFKHATKTRRIDQRSQHRPAAVPFRNDDRMREFSLSTQVG
jgi:hypothetical protein